MNGNKILVDTNALIYFDQGNKKVAAQMEGKEVCISFVSEIELLGFPGLSKDKLRQLESMLASVTVLEMTHRQKQIAIRLKQTKRMKTPDALIAAAALEFGIPLLTADKALANVEGISCILFEL